MVENYYGGNYVHLILLTIKMNMIKGLLLYGALILSTLTSAQVSKRIVVEHFTNTRCGTCANRNPGFFGNLANQSDVIHMAIHPSSPYSNCLLNNHNPSENDDRTNFYGIYGSTPKLVIQGELVPVSSDYSSQDIFTAHENQSAHFSIQVVQNNEDPDSIKVQVTVEAAESHNITQADLFVALTEDTVFYAAPNGEDIHHNVFRKALTPASGELVQLPENSGESKNFYFSAVKNGDWDLSRLFTVAILQDENDQAVLQSYATNAGESNAIISAMSEPQRSEPILYPNPAYRAFTIQSEDLISVRIYDLFGKEVFQQNNIVGTKRIDMKASPKGTYVVNTTSALMSRTHKLILK